MPRLTGPSECLVVVPNICLGIKMFSHLSAPLMVAL
ncbi:unnamed protein product [Prunus brigantina]